MRLRRTIAGVALAVACGTAAAVGLSAPAYASVTDTGSWFHITGWGDGKCLWDPANPGLDVLEVHGCENTPYEQWDSGPNPTDHMQLINHATGLCAAVGTNPAKNSAAIVMEPCNTNDPTQYWDEESQDGTTHLSQIRSVAGHDFCLDRPTQADYDGEHMQMWECQGTSQFPDWDNHYEQDESFTQHID